MNNEKSIQLYQAIADGNERRKFEHWHASSIADCPRSHYFKRMGVEPVNKPSAALVIRWSAGHNLEESIRPYIEKVYGKTESNKRYVSKKLDLTGEFDNLVLTDNRLVEIKSVHDFAFVEREGKTALKENQGVEMTKTGKEYTKWGLKETPYLHHELQNHAYVLLLAEHGIEVSAIDYVYISLSGRICVYSTKVQQELLDNVKARLDALNASWKTKTPPVCICKEEHPLYNSVYKYCDYQSEDGCCNTSLLTKKEEK